MYKLPLRKILVPLAISVFSFFAFLLLSSFSRNQDSVEKASEHQN
jgi:hypothetical protein